MKSDAFFRHTKAIIFKAPAGVYTAVCLAAILWLTLAPHPLPPSTPMLFPGADKAVHFIMFGALALCSVLDCEIKKHKTMATNPHKGLSPWYLFIIFIAVTLLGALIEWLQSIMGIGRSADLADLIADCAGAAFATASVYFWLKDSK